MHTRTFVLLALVIVSNVGGNFALSLGMKAAPAQASPIAALAHPAAVAGIAMLIAWTLLRMKLLGVADLSFVLPITSIGYALNVAAGAVLLGEQVSAARWAGAALIVAGAALTSMTPPSGEAPSEEPKR
ncbi:MAG TPA: hypothetical protein PLZ95_11740 [Bryobacteraceae bacterium]|nr:hypothetical protein [Bryobacteraceae bacterium]